MDGFLLLYCVFGGEIKRAENFVVFCKFPVYPLIWSVFLFIIAPKPINEIRPASGPKDVGKHQQDCGEPVPTPDLPAAQQLCFLGHFVQNNACTEDPNQRMPVACVIQIE